MSLMDKVKAQAEYAVARAQRGVSQGQAKLDALQTRRRGDELLRDLGAAYYAQRRTGGSAEAVAEALSTVDRHVAEHGPVDAPPATPSTVGMPRQSTGEPDA